MGILVNLLLLDAVITCGFTLWLSIYPGVLNKPINFVAIASLWLLLIVGCTIAAVMFWRKYNQRSAQKNTKSIVYRFIAITLVVICSYVLLKFYVPRRIGFAISRPAFEQWLTARPSQLNQRQSISTTLGIYLVDQYFAGSKGDRYFRVYQHSDGLGPDTVSYGFAYQPDPTGSPWGMSDYRVYRMGSGWYWFRASDD